MKHFVEEIVHVQGAFRLEGTLAIPTAKPGIRKPGALLIHGAGKGTLRDGVRELAHHLTNLGFVTLRYDKRGIGQSEGDFDRTGLWDFVDDAVHCLHFLRSQPEVDPKQTIVVGNSEGSLIAITVNAKTYVQGLILHVPNVQPLLDLQLRQLPISYEQMRRQPGFTASLQELAEAQRNFAEHIIGSTEDIIQSGDTVIPAKWVRDHYAYDVRKDLPSVHCPTLVISGGKDLLCDPADASRIAELVQGECEAHVIPNMTHALRSTDETVDAANVLSIHSKQWGQPVEPQVLQFIEAWVQKHFPQGQPSGSMA